MGLICKLHSLLVYVSVYTYLDNVKYLQDPAHCVCFHPDGNILVVGTQMARWLVIDLTTRETISSHTDGNEQIECVEFSPGKGKSCFSCFSCFFFFFFFFLLVLLILLVLPSPSPSCSAFFFLSFLDASLAYSLGLPWNSSSITCNGSTHFTH